MIMNRKLLALCASVTMLCTTACGENAQKAALVPETAVISTTNPISDSSGIEDPALWIKVGNLPANNVINVACDMLACYADTAAIMQVQNYELPEASNEQDVDTLIELLDIPGYTTKVSESQGITEALEQFRQYEAPVALYRNGEWFLIVGEDGGQTIDWEVVYLASNGLHRKKIDDFDNTMFEVVALKQTFNPERYDSLGGNIPTESASKLAINMLAITGNLSAMPEVQKKLNGATTLKEIRNAVEEVNPDSLVRITEHFNSLDNAMFELRKNGYALPLAGQNCHTGEFFMLIETFDIGNNPQFVILGSGGYKTISWLGFIDYAPDGVDVFGIIP